MLSGDFSKIGVFKIKSAMCLLFPILFYSRFVLSKFVVSSYLIKSVNLNFVINLKQKRKLLPEIIFWFIFVILRFYGVVSFFNKRVYIAGQAVFSKTPLSVKKSLFKAYKSNVYLKTFFLYLFANCRIMCSYWFTFSKSLAFIHNFMFKNVSFDERFNRLMHFSANDWLDFSIIVNVFVKTTSILHVIFLFREFYKIPIFNKKLKERKNMVFVLSKQKKKSRFS